MLTKDLPTKIEYCRRSPQSRGTIPLRLNFSFVCVQVSTFAINYRGHPFMESLTENRALLYSLAGAGGFVVMLALGQLCQNNIMVLPKLGRT
jgi:magnesium-transporting ATPase (P-type)